MKSATELRDTFRDAVMAALDAAALDAFGDLPLYQDNARRGAGAWDEDLPALFKAIDAQADKLAERYGFEVNVDAIIAQGERSDGTWYTT